MDVSSSSKDFADTIFSRYSNDCQEKLRPDRVFLIGNLHAAHVVFLSTGLIDVKARIFVSPTDYCSLKIVQENVRTPFLKVKDEPKSYEDKINLRVSVRRAFYELSTQVPIDIVVFTETEFETLRRQDRPFIREILKEKLLYEKNRVRNGTGEMFIPSLETAHLILQTAKVVFAAIRNHVGSEITDENSL